jgi:hypothetical protein
VTAGGLPALEPLLEKDPVWRPAPGEQAAWGGAIEAAGAAVPEPLRRELRWWRARALGEAGDWDGVSALAEAGLGEPFSVRESARLAFLHCLSGSIEEAEHVIAQAVQLHGDEGLPGRVAAWCEREGLAEAARRLR